MTWSRRARFAAVFAAVGLVAAGCSGGDGEDSGSSSQSGESSGETEVKYPADGFGEPAWEAAPLSDDEGASAEIYDDRVVRWGGPFVESRNPDGSVAWELDLTDQAGDGQSLIDVRQMSAGRLGLVTGESVSPDHVFLLDAETGTNLEEVKIPDDWSMFHAGTIDRRWGLPFRHQDDEDKNYVVNSDGSIDEFTGLHYATGESAVTVAGDFDEKITWHPTGERSGKPSTFKELAGLTPDRVSQFTPLVILDANSAIVRSGDSGESAAELIDFSKGKSLGVIEDCVPDDISDINSNAISPNGKYIAAGNALWEGTEATYLSEEDGVTARAGAVFDDGTVIANDLTGYGEGDLEDVLKNPVLMLKDSEVVEEFDNAESEDGRHQVAPKGTLSTDLVVYANYDGAVAALPRK